MLKKIIGVILIVIGAAVALGLFNGDVDKKREAVLQDAAYINNGKALPENEGKVVIVAGTPQLLEKAVDPDLKLVFNSPFIHRKLEIYKKTSSGSSGSDVSMKWESTGSAKLRGRWLEDKEFYGKLKIGDFAVSAKFLESMWPSSFKGFDEATAQRLNLKLQTVNLRQYLTEVITKGNRGYVEDENRVRLTYDYIEMSKVGNKTIVGVQKGNTLVLDDKKFKGAVYDNALTLKEVLENNKADAKFENIIGYVLCALIAAGGGYLFKSAK